MPSLPLAQRRGQSAPFFSLARHTLVGRGGGTYLTTRRLRSETAAEESVAVSSVAPQCPSISRPRPLASMPPSPTTKVASPGSASVGATRRSARRCSGVGRTRGRDDAGPSPSPFTPPPQAPCPPLKFQQPGLQKRGPRAGGRLGWLGRAQVRVQGLRISDLNFPPDTDSHLRQRPKAGHPRTQHRRRRRRRRPRCLLRWHAPPPPQPPQPPPQRPPQRLARSRLERVSAQGGLLLRWVPLGRDRPSIEATQRGSLRPPPARRA